MVLTLNAFHAISGMESEIAKSNLVVDRHDPRMLNSTHVEQRHDRKALVDKRT